MTVTFTDTCQSMYSPTFINNFCLSLQDAVNLKETHLVMAKPYGLAIWFSQLEFVLLSNVFKYRKNWRTRTKNS